MNYRLFTLVILILRGAAIYAQETESKLQMATDAGDPHLFLENPAINSPDKFTLSVSQLQRSNDYNVKYVFGPGVEPEGEVKVSDSDVAIGLLLPLGGGTAFGVTAEMLGRDIEHNFENSTTVMEEKIRNKYANARFIISLNQRARAAFGVRYKTYDYDIAGAFFVGDDDRTSYTGDLTGWHAGLFYDDNPLKLGIAYTNPLRGRVEIEDEKFIVAEHGFVNIDLGHGDRKGILFGAQVKKWLHKRDDRDERFTSQVDQRQISLNGLDLEQFLFPTIKYSLGLESLISPEVYYRASVSQTEYTWLFEAGEVPGKDSDNETTLKAYNGKLALGWNPSDFDIQIGYSYEQRKNSSIDPSQFWFAGEYKDYKATDTNWFAMFTYRK